MCGRRFVVVHLLLTLPATGCATRATSGRGELADWTVQTDARYLYGEVRGKLQTPTGGNPGTTSPNRPTLKELGFDHAGAWDVSATGARGDHRIYAGYRMLRLSGASTLDDPLVSQGRSFPAGTRVGADVTLDWLRAGYAHRFDVDLPGDTLSNPALYPAIGVAVLDFDYRLRQPGPGDVHRSYVLPTPQVGLGAEWPLTSRLTLVATGAMSVPVGSEPRIDSAEISVRQRVLERDRLEVEAMLGVAYDRIRYNDDARQTVPNDVDVRFGPALVAGLSIHF